jgi:Histidine kinase-, DNA gyrase B-, and HSP90-like ATPase
MGETRVDLLHLLEDLRDAYPGALEDTILTEILANALDSGASHIEVLADPTSARLAIVDNGSGMTRRDLRRYHDIAASTKTRGQGIGFAGVGIKLGLLVSQEVLTETRRGTTHVATIWHLASRQRAPWRWVEPPGWAADGGTAVCLTLRNPLSPLLDRGALVATVQRHFAPLLDDSFASILGDHYPRGVRFKVNGIAVESETATPGRVPVALRIGRRRKPAAVGYLMRSEEPLPEERRGLGVSAMGKVIVTGWDWLGLNPADPERVGGLIEIPALAECLTLNKADFLRTGPRGSSYLLHRRAVQEAVATQLAAWGNEERPRSDALRRRRARPMERDLATVLVDLAEDFPLLSSLVDRHAGGQRRLPVSGKTERSELVSAAISRPREDLDEEGTAAPDSDLLVPAPPPTGGDSAEQPTAMSAASESHTREPEPPPLPSLSPSRSGARRPGRYGLSIQFESRPDDDALGRLAESTVWVNEAHPAFVRATAARSEGYHLAVTVALVLAPLAVEASQNHEFVTAFLAHWGRAVAEKVRARSARGT